jgi:CspA family cold shock protein
MPLVPAQGMIIDRKRSSQPRFEAPSGPPVHGVVKWFSPEKGFGFVELSDGSGDAFLHGSVLAGSGIDAVQPGETLEVRVGPGHKGPHVTAVLSVDSLTATAAPLPPPNSRSATSRSRDGSVEETGRVKWFNTEKGYGFITRDSGAEDLFVHISAVERSGLRASPTGIASSSISPRGEKGWKQRGSAWSRSASLTEGKARLVSKSNCRASGLRGDQLVGRLDGHFWPALS